MFSINSFSSEVKMGRATLVFFDHFTYSDELFWHCCKRRPFYHSSTFWHISVVHALCPLTVCFCILLLHYLYRKFLLICYFFQTLCVFHPLLSLALFLFSLYDVIKGEICSSPSPIGLLEK